MATGTFTQNSLHKKILEPLKKSSRKGLKDLNLPYMIDVDDVIFEGCKWPVEEHKRIG